MPRSNLRVLFMLRAPVGGLFRHVDDLARGLVERGCEVGLVCDKDWTGDYWEERLRNLGRLCALGVHRLPMGRLIHLRDIVNFFKLRQLVARLGVDIIHGHGAKGGAYARLAGGKQAGKPACFYTPHGGSLHYRKGTLSGLIYHGVERALLPLTHGILFESAFARTRYGALISTNAEAFPVIHNGLYAHETTPLPSAENAADLVYVGELRALKGVGILLDALALIPQKLTLKIIGSGPLRNELQEQARRLSLQHQVSFEPAQPIHTALAKGRIAVMPSLAESLPYFVLEALAMHRPLIATSVGGIPEIFGPHQTTLVPPGNAALLAAAIQAALATPAALQKRTAELAQLVKNNFSVTHMVKQIINEYHQALKVPAPLSLK